MSQAPFNTTMRDKLQLALTQGVALVINKPTKPKQHVAVGRGRSGRFQSLYTICTNDGFRGVIGTPCGRCKRTL